MTILVADVGGTNSRLAQASKLGLDRSTIQHFQNDEFASFEDVIEAYLEGKKLDAVTSSCVAMAGPISDGQGTVTNRGWKISIEALNNVTGCQHSILLNDLTALGHAVGYLPDEQLTKISGDDGPVYTNRQSLVIGIGTGFNTCPVIAAADGNVCMEVEAGHVGLPISVARKIEEKCSERMPANSQQSNTAFPDSAWRDCLSFRRA